MTTEAGSHDVDAWRSTLRAALTTAMKERDTTAVAALRSALAAIDNAEAVDDPGVEAEPGIIAGALAGVGAAEAARQQLEADHVTAIVRAEIAERRGSAAHYEALDQRDRAAELHREAAVLEAFL